MSNSGSAPARDLKLSASPPSGWKVTFNPETVDEIAPGADIRCRGFDDAFNAGDCRRLHGRGPSQWRGCIR
ncbi:NEW3 domain-containing protein [Mesorhizobium atlanticum]